MSLSAPTTPSATLPAAKPVVQFNQGSIPSFIDEKISSFGGILSDVTASLRLSPQTPKPSFCTELSSYSLIDQDFESSVARYASILAQNVVLYRSGVPAPVVAAVNLMHLPIMGAEARFSIGDLFYPTKSLERSIARTGQEVQVSVKQAGAEARFVGTALIKEAKSAAKELVLEIKDQGVITVKEIGGQLQVMASESLKEAFGDAEIFIESAGQTIRAITVQSSREASESAVRGAMYALTDTVFGQSEREQLRRKIAAYFLENPEAVEVKIRHLLSFIYSQNQASLTAENKAVLYEELVRAVNEPGEAFNRSERLYLLIGAKALTDTDLYVEPSWIWTKKDPVPSIIEAIPPAGIREMLLGGTTSDALEFFPEFELESVDHASKTNRLIDQLLDHSEGDPIGSVNVFASETLPEGYLECDGRALLKEKFPKLYDMLQDRYGETETEFNLPDYRGHFLRGWDHGAGRDPDAESRELQSNSTVSKAVGTVQEDEIKSHSHPYKEFYQHHRNFHKSGDHPVPHLLEAASRGEFGGLETRPKNMNVLFAIKARPSSLDIGVTQIAEELIELQEESERAQQAQETQMRGLKDRLDEIESQSNLLKNAALMLAATATASAIASRCLRR